MAEVPSISMWASYFVIACYVFVLFVLWRYARANTMLHSQTLLRWICVFLLVVSGADLTSRAVLFPSFSHHLMPLSILTILFVIAALGVAWYIFQGPFGHSYSRDLEQSNERLKAEVIRRKSAEEELRHLSDSLEHEIDERTRELRDIKVALEREVQATDQAKKRMTSIFESAPNGMLVVNQSGVITQANSMVANIFRSQPEELVGQSVETLVPTELREQHALDRDNFQQSPSKRMMGQRRDLYGVRLDGTKVPLEVGLHPVGLDGNVEIVAAIVDISERKAYESRIHERNKALELSNRELQEFAFIASHDLKEPLRKIISFSKLLQEGDYGKMTPEGKEFSGYIVSAAERMRDLLADLLSYSRVTSKANPLKLTNLNSLLEEVLEDLQLSIDETGAQITVSKLPTIMADKVQMRQLFQNLISNSLKYRHSLRPVQVDIKGESDDFRTLISVKDNGIGFAAEYADQVFEVFKRLHDKSAYPGTGMGLAICRKIVQRHGGTIQAHSELDVGTEMVIEFPKQSGGL